jgi:hypothetical protein
LFHQDFEWPEDLISVATPHLKTQWTNWTINPRQYKYCSPYLKELTEQYERDTKTHYEGLGRVSNPELQVILKRKVDEHGRHPTLTGNKDELISRMYGMDYVDFINFFHPIRDVESSTLVDSIWENDILPGTIPPQVVSFVDLATLKTGSSLSYETFIASVNLINSNDRQACESYDQIYLNSSESSTRQRSLIVHPAAAQQNMFGAYGSLTAMGISANNFPYVVYIPVRLDKCLIAVSFTKKMFTFYCVKTPLNPRRSTEKAAK